MAWDREVRRLWKNFLAEHGDELARAGFPSLDFQDVRRWWYFVDHSYVDGEFAFDLGCLNDNQCEILLDLLATHPKIAPPNSDVMRRLRQRLGKTGDLLPDASAVRDEPK